jgi:hypothetical protein
MHGADWPRFERRRLACFGRCSFVKQHDLDPRLPAAVNGSRHRNRRLVARGLAQPHPLTFDAQLFELLHHCEAARVRELPMIAEGSAARQRPPRAVAADFHPLRFAEQIRYEFLELTVGYRIQLGGIFRKWNYRANARPLATLICQ